MSSFQMLPSRFLSTRVVPLNANPGGDVGDEAWRAEGERIIKNAAVQAGAEEDKVSISWKVGRIIVTVDGEAYVPGEQNDSELLGLPEEFIAEPPRGVDVTAIARSINAAFEAEGEGSVGYRIAKKHGIEVTTPGASDELSGIMFESYKGFPVILDTIDPKTDKRKTIEGKLVERTDESTKINIKGRMRTFKNHLVLSVRLPKAKKEKGAR